MTLRFIALCAAAAFAGLTGAGLAAQGSGAGSRALPPTPTDVQPGSITAEDVPYPQPVSYLPLTLYGQDVRMAYMDVPPTGQPNGRTVVLLHSNNFAFFWRS